MRNNFEIMRSVLSMVVFSQTLVVLAAQTAPQGAEIIAVGDILLARGVQVQIEKYGDDYAFGKVTEILRKADLAIGNLENPLTNHCGKGEKKFSFQAKPHFVGILRAASFDVLSLANNHILDCGSKGLIETIDNLEKEGVRWLGAGKTEADAGSPLYLEVNKIKIAFVGFTAIAPGKLDARSPHVASATDDNITRTIRKARRKARVVIVSFHWGTEYADRPNLEQIRFANTAVSAGADVIVGHHPHVLQGFQLVNRSVGEGQSIVAYSLGNFLFDSPVKLNKRVGESVVLKLRLDKYGLVAAEAVPIVIKNYRPMIADETDRLRILNRLNRLSGDFKTGPENGYLIREKGNVIKNVH